MVILNAKWFLRQVRNFRPPDNLAIPEPATASLPPPIPAETTLSGN
jgi:hypothetical protein